MIAERNFTAMRYPRSFLGLLIAAFLLVALPLLGTLLYSAWHTQRLTEQGRSAVFGATKAATASRALVSRIGSIERLALQVAALPDPRLRQDLARAHAGFKQLSGELAQLPLGESQRGALNRTIDKEQALVDFVTLPRRGGADPQLVRKQAEALVDDAYQVLAVSYFVADREVERLGASADEVHRRLIVMVLIATALALAAALALTRLIARPIAEIDSAIRQLGSADFERPIRVSGPQDLQALGERLDWLRLRLTELEAQKNRFLRHLSHDLKTPLAALREGTELLNDQVAGPLAPPQRQVVAILRDNSVKLQRLIEDLLDYQRALHAASALRAGPVALDGLLRQSVRSHQLAAQAKAQRLELDAPPLTVWADAAKLRSVIDNLIGNAVKFTPPSGEIRVLARQYAGMAAIDIVDSGPGVPLEEREAIFEAFFRGRAGAFGRAEGTGLGLAIAREFTEAHGGRIAVVSGTRGGHFRVTLPVRPAAPLAEAA
ncbi:MAG TPA: HAMP domain-containing sensor histidine kinase [Burkholderiales bacterium]|nr:HAMP domain-containing sensor histidine kinase [Burkholderiales bacterium]